MVWTIKKPSGVCPECGGDVRDGLLIYDDGRLFNIHPACKEAYINRRLVECPDILVNRHPDYFESKRILCRIDR